MNKDIHNKFLKEVYKRILREDATKYNQTQQPEITRPEKGGVINRVPDMLRSSQPNFVSQRLQIDQIDPQFVNYGNGWWKDGNGNWLYVQPPFRPVGLNEHGQYVITHPDRVPNLGGGGRFDTFPKNPADGDFTRIRVGGKYYYYRYTPGANGQPGLWIETFPFGWPDNMPDYPGTTVPPLPPPNGYTNPDGVVDMPGGQHGIGQGVGYSPFPLDNWPSGLPRPAGTDPNDHTPTPGLPMWPTGDSPADPALPPPWPRDSDPTYDDNWPWPWQPRPEWGYPSWNVPSTPGNPEGWGYEHPIYGHHPKWRYWMRERERLRPG